MEQRALGKTGEKIPVLGMGTWAMGNVAHGAQRREELRALKRGFELGMTFIDTAEMYGHGKSESLVGEAIAGLRDNIFLATKVSPENFSYESVLRSCTSSIERLGVKYIDLYQLHWPNPRIPIRETMKAMEELVSSGRIRYIGVSNFSVEQTMEAQESLPRSEIVSNQVRYSITSRSIESRLVPFCEKEKVTIIAYSPLDTGTIPKNMFEKELLVKYNFTPAQLMINWVTRRKSIVTIPKAARVDHVEDNARSLEVSLSRDDYERLSNAFR